jgi:hypothetical protein
MKNSVILLFFMAVIIFACKKVPITPNTTPKYSVYAVLNPNEPTIKVFANRVFILRDTVFQAKNTINNALITISDGKNSKSLTYNTKTGNYEALNDSFLKPKTTYTLKAIFFNTDTLLAQTTIPATIENIIIDKKVDKNNVSIKLNWLLDPLYTKNIKITSYKDSKGITGFSQTLLWDNNFSWRKIIENNYGNTFQTPEGTAFGIESLPDLTYTIFIDNFDKQAFEEDLKIEKQNQVQGTIFEKFETPYILPSNIKNGVGLFGSKTKTEVNVFVK